MLLFHLLSNTSSIDNDLNTTYNGKTFFLPYEDGKKKRLFLKTYLYLKYLYVEDIIILWNELGSDFLSTIS